MMKNAILTSKPQVESVNSRIEVRLREIDQMFDPLGYSPLGEKELHRIIDDYIVGSYRKLHPRAPYELVIHLDRPADIADQRQMIVDAIRAYFARRAQYLRRDLRLLIRRGFISLGIGFAFLAVLYIIGHFVIQAMSDSALAGLVRESLLIVGWVAMWRPLEIFLYDWWPILGERRIYERLSQIDVRIV